MQTHHHKGDNKINGAIHIKSSEGMKRVQVDDKTWIEIGKNEDAEKAKRKWHEIHDYSLTAHLLANYTRLSSFGRKINSGSMNDRKKAKAIKKSISH